MADAGIELKNTIIQLLEVTSGDQAIAVASTATVRSQPVSVKFGEFFALAYQASSGGTISLDIEVEMSHDNVSFATIDNAAKVKTSLADSNYHVVRLSPVPMPYLRIKVTGTGSNAASTTINLWLSAQQTT